jgi:hypothetical protein
MRDMLSISHSPGENSTQFGVHVFMEVIQCILRYFRANKNESINIVSSDVAAISLLKGSPKTSQKLVSQNITVKLVTPDNGVSDTPFDSRSREQLVAMMNFVPTYFFRETGCDNLDEF